MGIQDHRTAVADETTASTFDEIGDDCAASDVSIDPVRRGYALD
jgi:hypothetical protein